MSDTQSMAMLEKRRIEAAILKHVYDTLESEPRRGGGEEGNRRSRARVGHGSRPTRWRPGWAARPRPTFIDRQEMWTRGGALERDIIEQSDTRYRFNVTRCKYAEMYRDMGLGEIGHLLSCQRDGTFCEGYQCPHQVEAHADPHAGREPLRLRLHVREGLSRAAIREAIRQ